MPVLGASVMGAGCAPTPSGCAVQASGKPGARRGKGTAGKGAPGEGGAAGEGGPLFIVVTPVVNPGDEFPYGGGGIAGSRTSAFV